MLSAVLLAGPAVLAFACLAAWGAFGPVAALAGILGTIATAAAAYRLQRRELEALATHLARLDGASEDVPLPSGASPTLEALASAASRMQREARLRHERMEARLRATDGILDALHDPLVLIDGGRRVLRANHAALAVFGDRIAERDLAATLRNPALLAAVDAVLGGAASRTLEFTLPVPVERVYEARVTPFRGEEPGQGGDGAPSEGALGARVILTLHDITAIKRSEQMRADFVANASHELRTPLASLVGFIETLRGPARDDPDAQARFLGIMNDQAQRMSRLVNDLLSLSRIELDEHTPPTGEADVVCLVGNVIATLELKAASRKMKIRLEVAPDLPHAVGDEDQLSQVFQNLVHNAVKYGREGTEVTVRVGLVQPGALGGTGAPLPAPAGGRRSGPMLSVSVTDRGEGIPRTHLPRLTERFYRVDAARSRAMGGTGLGLAIVKHIVNRHRGRLTIESEVGRGSTFTVYLPAADVVPATARLGGVAAG